MQKRNVALIGVGGGGMNTLDEILKVGTPVARFIAVNRDLLAIKKAMVRDKVHLDAPGSDPGTVREAVRRKESAIRRLLDGMDAVVLVAGMGGVTGSHASPEIARIAKQCGLPVWAVVTRPFTFEGSRRARAADKGMKLLSAHADGMICVHNQDLIGSSEKSLSMLEAFRRVDAVVAEVAGTIAEHGMFTGKLLARLPGGCSAMPCKSGNAGAGEDSIAPDHHHCSFCGRHRSEVRKLISGPSVFICNECVALCVEIINEEGD